MTRGKPRLSKPSEPRPQANVVSVPTENVEILRQGLGLDVENQPEVLREFVRTVTTSISSSPYPSGQMLSEYRQSGFPDLADKVIATIDQQTAHRQHLEALVTRRSEDRQDRAQVGAQIIGAAGLVLALAAAYLGVSGWVCGLVIVVAIGGPNAATIVARVLDRFPGSGR